MSPNPVALSFGCCESSDLFEALAGESAAVLLELSEAAGESSAVSFEQAVTAPKSTRGVTNNADAAENLMPPNLPAVVYLPSAM